MSVTAIRDPYHCLPVSSNLSCISFSTLKSYIMKMRLLLKMSQRACFMAIGIFLFQIVPAQTPLLNPSTQPQFVNPLPIPPLIDGRNGGTFTISISQFYQDLGLRNPASSQPMLTKVWAIMALIPAQLFLPAKLYHCIFFGQMIYTIHPHYNRYLTCCQ